MASTPSLNPATGTTHAETKKFVRDLFEEFLNCRNLNIADIDFAAGFIDHGVDAPSGMSASPAGAEAYLAKRLRDFRISVWTS
jgi:hypothetical protein